MAGVLAYTTGGLLISVLLGAALGLTGETIGASLLSPGIAWVATGLGLVAGAREFGVLPLPLVQARRASNGGWVRWGITRAAFWWGVDIGSVVTTWMTFAGAWWIIGVGLLSGDPLFAAGLSATYWIGRAANVWLGPLIVPSGRVIPWFGMASESLRQTFRTIAGATLFVGSMVLAALASSSA